MTATLSLATPTFWLRLSMVARLMMPFKALVFITSERDCPFSAFLPLVFVLHKEMLDECHDIVWCHTIAR